MNRRACFVSLVAAAGAIAAGGAEGSRGIELQVDLAVDPAKQEEMLRIFHHEFHPAASKQPGFQKLEMLKLRSALAGGAPTGANYRFALSFASEELRKKWVETPLHKKLWPKMEATLLSKDYTILLYDVA